VVFCSTPTGCGPVIFRPLVKFDITSIPGAQIVKADFVFVCVGVEANPVISFNTVQKPWVEGDECNVGSASTAAANWGSTGTQAWSNLGGDFTGNIGSVVVDSTAQPVSVTLSPSAVQAWVDSPSLNYGFGMIKPGDGSGANESMQFYSSNTDTVQNRPKLIIYYY
jgi:hypothetical protein